MIKPRLLIVDDDTEIRTQMKWALTAEYDVTQAGDRASALEAFKLSRPSAVLLDLGLPPRPNEPEEGLAALAEILAVERTAKVLIVSGQGEKENALRAVGAGAYDFLCKPIDLDELKLVLRRCVYVAELERENRALQQSLRSDVFEGMIGSSAQMQSVFAMIRKVAASSAPILLLGESGTVKEMAAAAIHRRSARKEKPFVAINCSAIPENLIESELFGHEKGAFTGAQAQRKGLLESAEGGTLFLDEIGDLPPSIQVKLLRFLQEQTFLRVGGRQEIQTDARIVAATNADLKQAVASGAFREDLFFRLAVIVVNLPPLRERGEDFAVVAQEFLNRFAVENGKSGLSFASDAQRAMQRHTWPGNVRELQNRIQRGAIMTDGKRITAADLDLDDASESGATGTLKEARDTLDREMIQRALKRHGGKIAPAAAELAISRPTFYELMEKLGVTKE
ncbi:MAG: PEP-CTERM-box response regulator transcription factor [Chthoniobacteraceae bacterium]